MHQISFNESGWGKLFPGAGQHHFMQILKTHTLSAWFFSKTRMFHLPLLKVFKPDNLTADENRHALLLHMLKFGSEMSNTTGEYSRNVTLGFSWITRLTA